MPTKASDSDLLRMMEVAEARAKAGKLRRLQLLSRITPSRMFSPILATMYFEEARLCWYSGAFVACILMVQLAFEELLRDHYRVALGVGGMLKRGMSVDAATFSALIERAQADGLVSEREARRLHRLRRRRNPFVHSKDAGDPTWLVQAAKFVSRTGGPRVAREADAALRLLNTTFPTICERVTPWFETGVP